MGSQWDHGGSRCGGNSHGGARRGGIGAERRIAAKDHGGAACGSRREPGSAVHGEPPSEIAEIGGLVLLMLERSKFVRCMQKE